MVGGETGTGATDGRIAAMDSIGPVPVDEARVVTDDTAALCSMRAMSTACGAAQQETVTVTRVAPRGSVQQS
jgi:hypothetical protein